MFFVGTLRVFLILYDVEVCVKKVCFLIGGLGNVFFQLLHTKYPKDEVCYSDLLLGEKVRKLFKQSNHDNVSREVFGLITGSYVIHFIILLFDIFLYKVFRKTIFSRLDCNIGMSEPCVYEMIYLGYFQSEDFDFDDLSAISDYVHQRPFLKTEPTDSIIIHYRKGDFSTLGIDMNDEYYANVLSGFFNVYGFKNVLIISNDRVSSEALKSYLFEHFGRKFNVNCISGSVVEDFSSLLSAKYLVASNSTFSLAAAMLSKELLAVHFHSSLKNIFLSCKKHSIFIE